MKLLKQVVLLLAIMLAMAMPVSVYAARKGTSTMAVEVWEQERELIFGAATMRVCA